MIASSTSESPKYASAPTNCERQHTNERVAGVRRHGRALTTQNLETGSTGQDARRSSGRQRRAQPKHETRDAGN